MVVNIKNLVKRYGSLVAVDHLDLQIEEGEIYGLLGPNGSGKTTTINCILSLLKYDKGEVTVFGKEMTPTSYEIKKDIGVIFQNIAVFDELSVYENIYYFCSLYKKDKKEIKALTEEAISFVSLEDYKNFKPKKLSGGLLRRLNIACGIAHKPKLVILDEPTVAVDPQSRNKILQGIKDLNKAGATVIYTSHYMEEVEQICSMIGIMDKGKIIAEGTKDELKNLISMGEKIRIEVLNISQEQIEELKELSNIYSVKHINDVLTIKSTKGKKTVVNILEYLNKNDIPFGEIIAEPPTLNDVFLEITGKELRD